MFLVLCLCISITLIFIFFTLKTANKPCIAKFGPLRSEWKITPSVPLCVELEMNGSDDWKVKIHQSGFYIIYSLVVPNTTYKGTAPFEVQLLKNNFIIQTLNDNSTAQNVGGTYELRAGDTIALRFNHKYQVIESDTHWGIIWLANPHFISQ
ncbi:tumor necrosis factor ligand superfamily member 18 isoform X2 [Echinops telfairi]|uniref:Tumor necrosis factor ligand superfamily member 18 isoform X2 n=1 Tax=Echinops telfairi TaxID=9371 RepID=A0AC55DR02_ECHTE|nr:tumor necrosis factor ligand superfamily member 18 isoform X2 [Echinops telfairi]